MVLNGTGYYWFLIRSQWHRLSVVLSSSHRFSCQWFSVVPLRLSVVVSSSQWWFPQVINGFQQVPNDSHMLPMVLTGSQWFLTHSVLCSMLSMVFKMVPTGYQWFLVVPTGYQWFLVVPPGYQWSLVVGTGYQWVPNGSRQFPLPPQVVSGSQ